MNRHMRGSRHQTGLSLVELLVGVAVGLFVVAGAAMLVGSQLSENRRLLLETQLQQDLRSSADIITRELRRAGFWSQAEYGVWTPTSAPLPNFFATLTTPAATEVNYTYRRGPGQEGPYGFRLSADAIQTLLAAGGWQDLTDPRTVRITALNIAPTNSDEIVLPCPKDCPGPGGPQDCWPRLVVRSFTVTITGQAVHDAAIQRTLQTTVRLRNDHVRFNDPLNPSQYCPA